MKTTITNGAGGLMMAAILAAAIAGAGCSGSSGTSDTGTADAVQDVQQDHDSGADGNEAVDSADQDAEQDTVADAVPDEGRPTPTAFRAGYAEIDITGPVGTIMGGYGVPAMNRVTTGTHDPLMAQAALFVNDIGDSFLIISADLAGFMWDFGDWGPGIKVLRQNIVEAFDGIVKIRPENIVVASSHSHGATDLMGFNQNIGEGPNKDLIASTIEKMTTAAVNAAESLQDAVIYSGMTELVGYSSRDKDCSPVLDNSVAMIQARKPGGDVIVTIANYTKHPTIAPESNRLATADFIWGFREEMQESTNAPAMYLQGFEAAVHGKYSFYDEEDVWDKVHEVGAALADAVTAAASSMTAADSFDIRHRETTYSCPGRDSFMVDAYTYMDMPKRYMDIMEDGSLMVQEIPISWHKMGPVEFVVFPGEPVPEYAMMSKDRMVSPVKFAVGLGNDATGYMVEPQSLANDTSGQLAGYELKMGLGPDAGPKAWEALSSLGWFDGAWNGAPVE